MPNLSTIVALGATAIAAASAHAGVLIYQFQGSLTNNSMAGGAFVGAPFGSSVSLEIAISDTTSPGFSTATANFWDGSAGTILAMKATVDGITSIVTPNSAPTRARVVNDSLLSGGPNHYDQFWFEVATTGAAPDFQIGSAILSRVGPGPIVPSSLVGTAFPTDSSQVDVSTFTLEHYIILRGPAAQFIRADITSATVIPAPGGAALAGVAALCASRRRRA
jgi:hypothetical protein